MGRLAFDMDSGEIDLTMSDTKLSEEAKQIVERLEASASELEDLPFVSIHSVTRKPGDIEEALEGTFRLRDERFALSAPVDWWDKPYRAPGERGFFQNSFLFANPLLGDPRHQEVLRPLATIIADWLTANPRTGATHPHRYAWHDHAAAGRLVVIAFVLREGVRRRLLDETLTEILAMGVLGHVQYLMADANHAANNHGLFSDAALALAAHSLESIPQAERWAKVAELRFAAVLDHTVDKREAMHLEHSPYYHWIIQGALCRFAAAGLFERLDLAGLSHRMEDSGAWLVAPDGTLPPIGDTPFRRQPPAAAAATSGSRSGMRVFSTAGYAVVRCGESSLFVTAAHHPTAHKHADDGSFCLYEKGRPLILDSGDPGYDYDSPEFRYGTSPAAHATICVDDFNWAKESPPYGSGILAAAEEDGLYGLLTHNPGAIPGGGSARRALVYAPGEFLLVIDDMDTKHEHELIRSLPLAPGLEAMQTTHGQVEILDEGSTAARLVSFSTPGTPRDEVEVVYGQRLPEMGGFSFPSPGTPEPRCDVRFSGAAGHPRAFALLMRDTSSSELPVMHWKASDNWVDVEIEIPGLTDSALTVRIGEDSVALGNSD